jgi:electron transfer flavoprotein alpha/beta subunit
VTLLVDRDAFGQRKYGVSLDREDLSIDDWCQHAIEEALDMAGYLVRVKETVADLRKQLAASQHAAQEYALLKRGLDQFIHDQDRHLRYEHGRSYQQGHAAYEQRLKEFRLGFESAQVLRQLARR